MIPVAISLFIKNAFGFVVANWKLVAVVTGVIALVIVFGLVFRACSKPKVQLDEKEIQKVNEAIETRNREQMEKVFVEIETKQERIAANVANGQAEAFSAIEKAKREVKELSDEELEALLESLK